MKTFPELDRFLTTDPADVGCAQALQMLHAYVDLILTDQAIAIARYPGITAHLRACGPCHDDFNGLLAAVTTHRDRPAHHSPAW